MNNLALKGEVCCSLVVVRLRGSYLNNAQATQRVAKLLREPVSGFLGMNPFATNQLASAAGFTASALFHRFRVRVFEFFHAHRQDLTRYAG
jgi:hypothetical protein